MGCALNLPTFLTSRSISGIRSPLSFYFSSLPSSVDNKINIIFCLIWERLPFLLSLIVTRFTCVWKYFPFYQGVQVHSEFSTFRLESVECVYFIYTFKQTIIILLRNGINRYNKKNLSSKVFILRLDRWWGHALNDYTLWCIQIVLFSSDSLVI